GNGSRICPTRLDGETGRSDAHSFEPAPGSSQQPGSRRRRARNDTWDRERRGSAQAPGEGRSVSTRGLRSSPIVLVVVLVLDRGAGVSSRRLCLRNAWHGQAAAYVTIPKRRFC